MSKNSEMRNKKSNAKQATSARKSGSKGPVRTQKKTTKKNTWFARKDGKVQSAAPTQRTNTEQE